MSRQWDTPEFWVRQEADEMLREMWGEEVDALADSLERSAASYDGGPEMAAAIVAELRRRAGAGIRFWPDPKAAELIAADPDVDLIDDDIPW